MRPVELIVGLEVHVRLDTGGKLFCACRVPSDLTRLPPNRQICDVCIGHPGTMPRLQDAAVEYGLALALALGAHPDDLKSTSRFERKHYFYWDLPKNYQVTQIDDALCGRTRVVVEPETAEEAPLDVFLNRIHVEEDAARISTADPREIRVDFNRSGTVLAEIVTEPEFRAPEEPARFLRHLRRVLQWHGLSSATLGNMRADVNLSVRLQGEERLNPKVEIKNLTSIDSLPEIIRYEGDRLTEILRQDGKFASETREWNDALKLTELLREKEEEADYWYYVEPDLVDLRVDEARLERAEELLRLRPPRREVWDRLAAVGFDEPALAALFATPDHAFLVAEAVRLGADPEAARQLAPLLKAAVEELDRRTSDPADETYFLSSRVAALDRFLEELAPKLRLLIGGLRDGKLQPSQLRILFEDRAFFEAPPRGSVEELLASHGMQPGSGDALKAEVDTLLDEVLAAHPEQSEAWLAGGDRKLSNFFQGQVMRRLPRGTDGKTVAKLLSERQKAG